MNALEGSVSVGKTNMCNKLKTHHRRLLFYTVHAATKALFVWCHIQNLTLCTFVNFTRAVLDYNFETLEYFHFALLHMYVTAF